MGTRTAKDLFLSVSVWLTLSAPVVFGQAYAWKGSRYQCPPAPCPAPQAVPAPTEIAPQPPAQPTQPPEAARPPETAPDLAPERSAALPGEQVARATPNMIGDLLIPVFRAPQPQPNLAGFQKDNAGNLIATRGAFKISEGENPRPQDRVFLFYNYFNNVGGYFDGPGIGQLNVHREMVGFEKTLLDRQASFGMRLPYFQFDGDRDQTDLGDISLIGKYTVFDDRDSGLLAATGLVLTVPTGGVDLLNVNGQNIHTTLIQPYVGYSWSREGFFVQGFSSLIVPFDSRDVTMMFNDLAVGLTAYRSQREHGLTSVTPVVEVHVNNPFNHRGSNALPFGIADIVNVTFGSHFVFNRNTVLTTGVVAPLTGPQPFDVEALVQLNYRF